jgi:transposase
LGNPIHFVLTGGERADCKEALDLLKGQKAEAVLADKGYDAGYIIEAVLAIGAKVVIPPKSNRKEQREYDKALYEERNHIERMFGKMKHFRRVATRYDKLAVSYMAFVLLAATCLWLK